jgi:hypothetical protein
MQPETPQIEAIPEGTRVKLTRSIYKANGTVMRVGMEGTVVAVLRSRYTGFPLLYRVDFGIGSGEPLHCWQHELERA